MDVLTRLGNYELVRLLAQGGMADIYLARERANLDHYVAVKVLNASRAADPESCSLFLDEARLLAMFDHNNLANVLEVDALDGVHYLAMEYVHGADLRELLAQAERAQRAIPYEASVAIVRAAAAGLDHAHRRCGPDGKPLHLVHRDVSLSNIMVGHDGGVKVVDFGIAIASVSSHHTNPGIVRGKASYMSPEQALGDDVDLRTDVFALGVVLYELTTGRRCFQGNSDFERMLAVVRGDYVPPHFVIPNFPAGLEAVIKKALTIYLSQRFASAAALLDALDQVARAEGWTTTPAAIADLMHELFGVVPEPWRVVGNITSTITASAIVEEAAVAETAPAADAPEGTPPAHQTVIITRRRLARGTIDEPIVAHEPVAPAERGDEEDDAPTRGRRSIPKMFAQRFAA